MTEPSSERIETARVIGRAVASPKGRKFLQSNGYQSGTPILACEWDTAVDEVIQRMRPSSASENVVVAIRKGERLSWMNFTARTGTREGAAPVHAKSTMGMLYQATQNEGSRLSVEVTNMTLASRMLAPTG